MRSPDQQAAPTRFAVDADALTATAARLRALTDELAAAIDAVRGPGMDAVGAVPPSDLFNALAFCWARWFQMLQDIEPALQSAARATGESARGYAAVETHLTAPSPGQ
jgi:hypothetical protein